ncbi:hypothetical protein BJX68DRAFT_268589 [Aspergillus pseudodeflectus]|uniref:Fungal N-terminal domain-containing protein n=1 Tax=Aspergillus pseudodeflectus TaxID=176178 RepID=A0ABR4K2R3_9EURO
MGDPVSVAASAAGLIALGLESCRLIVKYCDNWRGFDSDISNVRLKASGLHSTLTLIETMLSQNTTILPAIAADIKAKVVENEKWIKEVHTAVTKWQSATPTSGLGDKVRGAGKKIAYPFRREALLDTIKVLEGLQMNLHTALLVLQLQQTSVLAKRTELIQTVHSLSSTTLSILQSHHPDSPWPEPAVQNCSGPSHHVCLPSHVSQPATVASTGTHRRHKRCFCPGIPGLIQSHHRTCPLYNPRANARTARVALSSQWLGISIEVSLSFYRWANGLTISPTLRYHPIVSVNSPAFQIISRMPPLGSRLEEVSSFYETAIQELRQLFLDGKASPFDRTPSGATLLHHACGQFQGFWGNFDDCYHVSCFQLLQFLVEAGCPVNETAQIFNFDGKVVGRQTPMTRLISHRVGGKVVSKFMDLGAVVTNDELIRYDMLLMLKEAFTQNEEGFLVSDPVQAVLMRSEVGLKDLITATQRALSEDNRKPFSDGFNLLSIALSWPEAFCALLEFYPNLTRAERTGLLSAAIRYNVFYAVEALLDLGAPIPAYSFALCGSEAMEVLIMDIFISRRRSLLELAKNTLPRRVQNELGLRDTCLPDANAEAVFLAVKERHPSIDPSLAPADNRPVFHHGLKIEQMDYLYNSGFRDINAPDENGSQAALKITIPWEGCALWNITAMQYTISRSLWFFEKGVARDTEVGSGQTYFHIIALKIIAVLEFDIVDFTHRAIDIIPNILTSLPQAQRNFLLKHILTSSCWDSCACACSAAGCTPLNVALCCLLNSDNEWNKDIVPAILKAFITEMQGTTGCGDEVIRLLTFKDLSLTHTCCHMYTDEYMYVKVKSFDEGDATEIHDEERILIEEFEVLVEELQKEYETVGIPLWEFIQTHWCERVREYLVENEEVITPDLLCVALAGKVVEEWPRH